ncbi:MAG: putative metal-binding motif-containing protein, partial [Myxococcota bacterium]|nr:putative metal-binding motif-containing protein [Myxococcota bacterium]
MRLPSTLIPLMLLVACGPQDNDNIQLQWKVGETFNVAATYRVGANMTEENPVALDGSSTPTFGELWTDEVVWTYQVVEQGYTPQDNDELYPYAKSHGGTAELAVIKVSVDPSLNDDEDLLESDPVVYLVFREDRNRLAGVVTFTNVDGERVEQAYSSTHLDRSWSVLSQAMVSPVPTYLAPYSAKWGDADSTLENGHELTSVKVDNSTVDTFYDDEIDEDEAVDGDTWYYDDDGDGMTENDGDCDDSDSTVYKYAPELEDALDNDCDGSDEC